MKNNLKKIVAGLCALTMIPCLSVYAENASSIMSAKAASSFIVNDENNTIEFNKEITVTISPIQEQIQKASADNVTISTKNNEISGRFSGLEYINKISFIINAENTSSVVLKENAEISGKSYILKDGKEVSASFSGSVFECERKGENRYLLRFCTGINGDSYSFNIKGLGMVDNLSVESYIIENKYYKVEATYPDGEGICAYLPDSEGLNDENMTKWAKNQCLLANSLKHLTGIQGYDTVYYYFNGSCRGSHADAGLINWNDSEIRSGRIRFSRDGTKEELDLIKLNGNNYNFFTMHELGHVYGFKSKFCTAFEFDTYDKEVIGSGNDEYYTNVRALTALQNCENIKDHTVIVTNMPKDSNNMYPFKSYGDVYSFDNVSDDNHHYHIARGFIKACDWNWNKLETFYRAEGAPEYDSTETINAADVLVDTLGITIEGYNSYGVKRNSILHFVNMLRWLYSVSTGMEYNEDDFIKFIDETFAIEGTDVTGLECITRMLIKEKICSPIILKKKPQSAIAPMGSEVKTLVEAEGEGLSYQWYLCEPGEDEFIKSSVTGKSYSYTMTKAKNGRKVYCVITDANGNTVTTGTVMLGTVVITEQPKHAQAADGAWAKTTVKAIGNTDLTYKWYVKNPGVAKFYPSDGGFKETYSCQMEKDGSRNGRQVYCVISDKDGNSVMSDIVTLGTVVITEQPKSKCFADNEIARTSITVAGEVKKYNWYYKYIGYDKDFELKDTNEPDCSFRSALNGI